MSPSDQDSGYALNPIDPWTSTMDLIKGPASRRLVRFDVLCPLCEAVHSPEFYITLATEDPGLFGQAITRMAASLGFMETALKVVKQIHENDGDLQQLLQSLPGRQVAFGVIGHEVLEEANYTCDFCNAAFPSIAELRLHLGVGPNTIPDWETDVPACRLNNPSP